MSAEPLSPEEVVIREWVAAMTTESGSPLPPSERRAEPLPRRRVLPVIVTLLDIIDALRATKRVTDTFGGYPDTRDASDILADLTELRYTTTATGTEGLEEAARLALDALENAPLSTLGHGVEARRALRAALGTPR